MLHAFSGGLTFYELFCYFSFHQLTQNANSQLESTRLSLFHHLHLFNLPTLFPSLFLYSLFNSSALSHLPFIPLSLFNQPVTVAYHHLFFFFFSHAYPIDYARDPFFLSTLSILPTLSPSDISSINPDVIEFQLSFAACFRYLSIDYRIPITVPAAVGGL